MSTLRGLVYISSLLLISECAFAQINSVHGSWTNKSASAGAQAISAESAICTDQYVNTIVEGTNSVYFAGNFTVVGTCTSPGIIADSNDGTNLITKDFKSRFSGRIFSAISDGSTGWYVAGTGTYDGANYEGVIHINSDSSRDFTFLVEAQNVTKIYSDGTQLFLVGGFQTVNAVARNFAASVNLTTGAVNSFDPKINSAPTSIADNGTKIILAGSLTTANMTAGQNFIVSGTTLNPTAVDAVGTGFMPAVYLAIPDGAGGWYISGAFSIVGGLSRPGLARLNADGTVNATFAPNLSYASPLSYYVDNWKGPITGMLLQNGELILSGEITSAGGQPRHGSASLNPTTGAANSFNFLIGSMNSNEMRTSITGDGTNVYFGGSFKTAGGSLVGAFAKVNATTGAIDSSMPVLVGTVKTSVSDGAGGWYVGGSLTSYNGVAVKNLIHIQSDNSLDTTFVADANGEIKKVIKIGSVVYCVGNFTYINGQTRLYFAALDASDGSVKSLDAQLENGTAADIIQYGSNIIIGGDFTKIRGTAQQFIGMIDTSGTLQAFAPTLDGSPVQFGIDGDDLYVIGSFTSANSSGRNGAAAFDMLTGNLKSWNPNPDGSPSSISISSSGVYLAGPFRSVGGSTRYGFGKVDKSNGSALSWNPDNRYASGWFAYGNTVVAVGSAVYISADFSTIQGTARQKFAAVDATNGAPLSWSFNTDAIVYNVASDGTNVFIGGAQALAGVSKRHALAAANSSGAMTSWDPNSFWNASDNAAYWIVNTVNYSAGKIYVGGYFDELNGTSRPNLAAIDTAGNLTSWNPAPDSTVTSIKTDANNIYVGGTFNNVSGTARKSLAAFSKASGSLLSFDGGLDGGVQNIDISGGKLNVLGWFANSGSNPRNQLAQFDTTSMTLSSVYPKTLGNLNCFIGDGTNYFVGGNLSYIGLADRMGLVMINKSDSVMTSWAPLVNGTVNTIKVKGSDLYIGGAFTSVNSTTRNNLASVTLATGSLNTWNPNANDVINSMDVDSSNIYVGGRFTNIGGTTRNYFAVLNDSTGAVTAVTADADDAVNAVLVDSGFIYLGGYFKTIAGSTRLGSAKIATTGTLQTWKTKIYASSAANRSINGFAISNGRLFQFGDFSIENPQTRNYIAAIDQSGNLTAFNPSADGPVYSLLYISGKLLVGGDFQNIGGGAYAYLAELNATTGAATSWNSGADAAVWTITTDGTNIFVFGYFTTFLGQARSGAASYVLSTRAIRTGWNPNPDSFVKRAVVSGTRIFVIGDFANIGGAARNKIAELSTTTGAVTSWNITWVNYPADLSISNNRLFFAGIFNDGLGRPGTEIVSFDITGPTPALDSWYPQANGGVMYIATNSAHLYVSGDFSQINGAATTCTTSLDINTAATSTWSDNACYFGRLYATDSRVYFLAPTIKGSRSRFGFSVMNPANGDILF